MGGPINYYWTMDLNEYLRALAVDGVSDIHFKVGRPPLQRIRGILLPSNAQPLSPKDTEDLAKSLVGPQQLLQFKENPEIDTSYAIPGFSRFRVSVFRQRGTISIVMRIIPFEVPNLDTLGLPPVVKQIALLEHGLVLVTGAAGAGKSSTLAGIVNHINEIRNAHIITVEDPIEFLHRDRSSSINQREIGIDTNNWSAAFRAALRQDPDVILVGELRDTITMSIALRAAETGHLVLSTLHTIDAKDTVSRLIDSFPPHQQTQVRMQIANCLRAVISQRLLERSDKKGRVVAAEVMVVNAAIRGHILSPYNTDQIKENIVKGKDQYGMQTFDQALLDLVRFGKITIEEAMRNASSPNDLRLKLSLE